MRKSLEKIKAYFWWVDSDGKRHSGVPNKLSGDVRDLRGNVSGLRGDVSGLRGDVSGLRGNVSHLSGDVSGLRGNVSGLRGDIGACGLTTADRAAGVDVATLIKSSSDQFWGSVRCCVGELPCTTTESQ